MKGPRKPLPPSEIGSRCLLPKPAYPWQKGLASIVVHVLVLVVAIQLPLNAVRIVPTHEADIVVSFLDTLDDGPPEVPAPPPPKPRPIERKREVVPSPLPAVPAPKPLPVETKREEPVPRKPPTPTPSPEPVRREPPKVESAGFDRQAPKVAPVPERSVKAATFEGSSAKPTVELPARDVQTGGFGDPEGSKAKETSNPKLVAYAKVGSFELPQGPGQGNGHGGAQGVPGTVASAGFGNGIASDGSASGKGATGAGVRSAGFADAAAAPPPSARPRPAVTEAPIVPVEILSKPKPIYTQDARDQRLEGEVVLEVLFSAQGKPRVLRVVRGLGHGLDEEAVRAAERIAFKPARRNGAAIDYTATVRMIFSLA